MNTANVSETRVFDVTAATFERDVLERSRETPVLIDFWASWCGPCKTLGPILEKLTAAYGGRLLLGKVDVDAEQALAGHFQIRSIPTVMLVVNGQIVDGFSGALPDSGVREFLARHGIDAAQGDDAPPEAPRDSAAEVKRLRAALDAAPDDAELRLDLAVALLANGEHEQASGLIDGLPAPLDTDRRTQRARAQIGFARVAQDAADPDTLARMVSEHPDDLDARHRLGARLLLLGDAEPALAQFLAMLERDRGFRDGLPRRALVDAFSLVDDEVLVRAYRKRMTALLF